MKSLYCPDAIFSSLFADANMEERIAIAAYWVTDGVDRCPKRLPRHCVWQTRMFDGRLAQVVCMLADSENLKQRQFLRYNRGVCYATLIDTELWSSSTATNTTAVAGGASASSAAALCVSARTEEKNKFIRWFAKSLVTEVPQKAMADDDVE